MNITIDVTIAAEQLALERTATEMGFTSQDDLYEADTEREILEIKPKYRDRYFGWIDFYTEILTNLQIK